MRQVAAGAAFQLRGRIAHRPTVVPLGRRSRLIAELHSHSAAFAVYANPPHIEMLHWAVLLRPGDLFIDVGANVGLYSIWAADAGADVIAVEPDPAACRQLAANRELNGYKIDIVQAALAERPGERSFTRRRGCVNRFALAEDTDATKVTVLTLDELIGDRTVAGIKIDVEGAERLVLEGGRRALAEHRVRVLQIEWNQCSQRLLGETREPLRQLLAHHGYELYRPTEAPGGPWAMSDADVFARPSTISSGAVHS